jgi:exodeoxyribonuclease VII large subunit
VASRLSPQLLRREVERRRERYDNLNRRLRTSLIANAQAHRARLARHRDRVTACGNAAHRAMRTYLDRGTARVERAERLLAAFSYREVLKRGFALVRDGEGRPLHAAADVPTGLRLEIEFADGRIGAVADGEARPTAVSKSKPRNKGGEGGPSGQGSLFG